MPNACLLTQYRISNIVFQNNCLNVAKNSAWIDHIVEFFLENSGSHEGLDTLEPSRKSCILRIYIPNYKDSENNNGQEYNL